MPIEGEKMFGAEMPDELIEQFSKQIDNRGFLKKKALAAAIRLWLDLPADIQARLISGQCPSLLIDLVNQILDEKIEQGRKAAKKLLR